MQLLFSFDQAMKVEETLMCLWEVIVSNEKLWNDNIGQTKKWLNDKYFAFIMPKIVILWNLFY
jgi:hypothetical protein